MAHLLRWLVFSLCLAFFAGCDDNDDDKDIDDNNGNTEVPTPQLANKTVLMYVSAQNSLGHKGFHESDSIEVAKGHHFIQNDDNFLVYMDDERNPRIYRYTNKSETPEIVRTWTEDVNSSSPETLRDVLSWTKTNYPAKEYGLVMWSHSDGWLPATNKNYRTVNPITTFSFGIDVNENGNMGYDSDEHGNVGAQMDIKDMAAAIQNSGIYLKYIFFDSCLMQNLETAYSLRNIAEYIIASPIQIPGPGANYTHMLEKGLFTNAEQDIVDTYTNDVQEGLYDIFNEYYDYGVVISSIRTDKLESLAKTTADVLQRSKINNGEYVDLTKENVLNYQAYHDRYFYRPDNFDAQEAMKVLLSEEDYKKFETALNATIVNKGTTDKFWIGPSDFAMKEMDPDNFCGVSIFIPQKKYTFNKHYCPYGDLNLLFQKTEWYKAAGWAEIGW